jgi:shikimate dehydrogenase
MIEPVVVRGTTRLVGILGYPVAHSLSPLIHNHIFNRKKLDLAYVPLPVPPVRLAAAVVGLRACGFAGANVTVPHKQAVVPWCDVLSGLSTLTRTVNTLYFQDNLLHGTSTDAEGFFRSLDSMGVAPADAEVVILGNGGTARTLAIALAVERPPRSLVLVGRSAERVRPLAEEVGRVSGYSAGWTTFTSARLRDTLARCSLLVNCTSAGMHPKVSQSPLDAGLFHSGMSVFDTIYNPAKTLFLTQAKAAGCRTRNGLSMLLFQALASQRFWTGVEAEETLFDLQELQNMVLAKG